MKLSKDYAKLFNENYHMLKIIQQSDIKLLHAVLEEIGGEYEWEEDEDKPIVCLYLGYEPTDAYVNKVFLSDGGVPRVNVTAKEDVNDYDVDLNEVMEGHISFIYDYMNIEKL